MRCESLAADVASVPAAEEDVPRQADRHDAVGEHLLQSTQSSFAPAKRGPKLRSTALGFCRSPDSLTASLQEAPFCVAQTRVTPSSVRCWKVRTTPLRLGTTLKAVTCTLQQHARVHSTIGALGT